MDENNTHDQTAQEVKSNDNELLTKVRNKAFSSLLPLIDELDDTPSRKFDICLAAVRSTDNAALLEKALFFAEQIEDGSERAQALIDVANEATVRLS